MDKLTKHERKYLSPFVKHRKTLDEWVNGKWYWDGDLSMPMVKGSVCNSLIKKGLLVEIRIQGLGKVRTTAEVWKYRCKNNCYYGRIIQEEQDAGKCSICEGTGLSIEASHDH